MAIAQIEEIAEVVKGRLISGDSSTWISTYSIDSRTLQPGDLFFAIQGAHHDGHQFVAEALRRGAIGAIISREVELARELRSTNLIMVSDTHQALKELASYFRRKWKFIVVGITGSSGKTTTKEIAFDLLQGDYRVKKTPGNYNNLYGLPLGMLSLEQDDELFLGEMGISEPREMEKLIEISQPNVGVITNVNPVHLEFFSSVEEIAEEKGKLLEGLRGDRVAIVNSDNPWTAKLLAGFTGRVISFGIRNSSDIMGKDIEWRGLQGSTFTLVGNKGDEEELFTPLVGLYNLYNALAAIAVACNFKVPLPAIKKKLARFKGMPMRSRVLQFKEGFTLLDDTYNSNPKAFELVLDHFKTLATDGRKIVISGDMLELGEWSEAAHRNIGRMMANGGIDLLIGVGNLSRKSIDEALKEGMPPDSLVHFPDSSQVGPYLSSIIREKDLLLVKGSRAMKMELIVDYLKKHFNLEGD